MFEKNQTLKYIQKRSSIRDYTDEPITKDESDQLKCAVLAAPTALDQQQLRYSFITDEIIIRKIDERIFHYCGSQIKNMLSERQSDSFFYGAPLAVVITGKDTNWTNIDGGIAVQTLAIAAQSMGLSSVILGLPQLAFRADDPNNCCDLLQMKEGERFCIAIAIGHAATTKEPHVHNIQLIRDFN